MFWFSRHIFTGQTFRQICLKDSKWENIQIKYKPTILQKYVIKIIKFNSNVW